MEIYEFPRDWEQASALPASGIDLHTLAWKAALSHSTVLQSGGPALGMAQRHDTLQKTTIIKFEEKRTIPDVTGVSRLRIPIDRFSSAGKGTSVNE